MASFQLKPQMRGKGQLKTSEKSIPRRRNSMCKALEAHKKMEVYWNAVKQEKRAASSKRKAQAKSRRALRIGLDFLVNSMGSHWRVSRRRVITSNLCFRSARLVSVWTINNKVTRIEAEDMLRCYCSISGKIQ